MLKSFTTLEKEKIDSIAIGGFDGIHLAHQALISRLSENGALVIVHRGGVGLTPAKERCFYHDKICIILEFEKIKGIEAEAFITYLQENFPALKKIVVGYDFRFGKDRRGDAVLLKNLFEGEVEIVQEVFHDGISVHSGKIKEFLKEGNVLQANSLLGRIYSVKGSVITGQGLGKKVLYPTINITTGDFFLPKEGVYATFVEMKGKRYPAVTFIGKRLSTDAQFSVETHILQSDFIGEKDEMILFFRAYLRENRKFDALRDLKEQISLDIEEALSIQ